MILIIGELLYDVFPDYKVMGGAPFNVAYHLIQLNQPAHFISRIGTDLNGDELVRSLQSRNFPIPYIQRDPHNPTGKVNIKVDIRGLPSYEIVNNVAYDFLEFTREIESLLEESVDLVYFGTLVQRSQKGFATVQRILAGRQKTVKGFYDVNLRKGSYNRKIIDHSLQHTEILKLNHEELIELGELLDLGKRQEEVILKLMEMYSLEMISLTRGEEGSSIHTPEGSWQTDSGVVVDLQDTVGAGDAYAAMTIIGLLHRWHPQRILHAASEFAAGICQIKGAIPADEGFYQPFRDSLKEGIE